MFDRGQLTREQAEDQIRLPADELSDWRFTGPDEWHQLVTPGIARRLNACTSALTKGETLYLEDDIPR